MIKGSKNDGANSIVLKNFVLLGDPALKLAYPKYNVITTHINNTPVSNISDTIKAKSLVTVKGIVTDANNNKINYNGVLFPTIYDKPYLVNTLANDPASYQLSFELPKAILYKGMTTVLNGDFEFSFVVPKDIAYNYGFGKISYYAKNNTSDATGFYNKIMVGSIDNNVIDDIFGPQVKLFMNDTNFVSGGITDENPVLLAKIKDESGINTVGNGIGHDVIAYLDGNNLKPILLNDYYVSDIDQYNSGSIYYPLSELNEGLHTIRMKVWDVFNNSSEGNIDFIVAKSAEIALHNLINYPNPFNQNTHFIFEHNQAENNINVQIEIFDMNGNKIKIIKKNTVCNGYKIEPIEWNGTTDSGKKIDKGMYIYRLTVSKDTGEQNVLTSKLVFIP